MCFLTGTCLSLLIELQAAMLPALLNKGEQFTEWSFTLEKINQSTVFSFLLIDYSKARKWLELQILGKSVFVIVIH